MFTLGPEQLQAFAQYAKDTFVNQMLTQLRQHFPAHTTLKVSHPKSDNDTSHNPVFIPCYR